MTRNDTMAVSRDGRRRLGAAAWLVVGIALLGLSAGGCADARAEDARAERSGDRPAAAEGRAARVLNVATTPLAERRFAERLAVQGNLSARASAAVGAKITGTLVAVHVDEGDTVVAGETPLFQVDDTQLVRAVEANQAALDLARTNIEQARAAQRMTAANRKKASRDVERYRALHESRSVSDDALERAETGHAQARAADQQARVAIQLAKDQARQAAVALAIAEQNLADTTVVAPVSGTVTLRSQEPGEMALVGPGARPIIHIVDPSLIEVSAFLPANVYERVRVGETPLRVRVYGTDRGTLPVSYKSPIIDPATRTFEVRCLLENPDGAVAPGAMAEVEVTLAERRGLGVPERAVVERSGERRVFVVEEGHARLVPVAVGLETDGWVEVQSAATHAGTPMVTDGQSLLADGDPVRVTDSGDAGTDR